MKATRRNLQAQPKILKKKLSEHQINQSERKLMFSTLKVLRSKKFVWGLPELPDGIRPESQKIIGLTLSTENLNLKRRSV
jgi:hypothetical protein